MSRAPHRQQHAQLFSPSISQAGQLTHSEQSSLADEPVSTWWEEEEVEEDVSKLEAAAAATLDVMLARRTWEAGQARRRSVAQAAAEPRRARDSSRLGPA